MIFFDIFEYLVSPLTLLIISIGEGLPSLLLLCFYKFIFIGCIFELCVIIAEYVCDIYIWRLMNYFVILQYEKNNNSND